MIKINQPTSHSELERENNVLVTFDFMRCVASICKYINVLHYLVNPKCSRMREGVDDEQ